MRFCEEVKARLQREFAATFLAFVSTNTREEDMGSTTDKIKGYANKAAGSVKKGVGKAVGNDRLRAKGAAQAAKGEAQKTIGKAKGAIKDAADTIADKAHKKL